MDLPMFYHGNTAPIVRTWCSSRYDLDGFRTENAMTLAGLLTGEGARNALSSIARISWCDDPGRDPLLLSIVAGCAGRRFQALPPMWATVWTCPRPGR
jgi:hypothetical protein